MAENQQIVEAGHTPPLLLWSLCAGPLAWGLDLALSYVLTQHSCSTGHHYVLHLITAVCFLIAGSGAVAGFMQHQDRKSTRLNSSHMSISYAVFCLKKKKKKKKK